MSHPGNFDDLLLHLDFPSDFDFDFNLGIDFYESDIYRYSGVPLPPPQQAAPASRLLELPLEVREMIYGFVLRSDTGLVQPLDFERAKVLRDQEAGRKRLQQGHVRQFGDEWLYPDGYAGCSCGSYHTIARWEGPKDGLKLVDNALFGVSKQVIAEAYPVLVKKNGVKDTSANNIAAPAPEVRFALEHALHITRHVHIELDANAIDFAKSWWFKILGSKTNLHTFTFTFTRSAMEHWHSRNVDGAFETLWPLRLLRVRDKGEAHVEAKGRYPQPLDFPVDPFVVFCNKMQANINKHINSKLVGNA